MFDSQTPGERDALIAQVSRELAELQAAHDDSDRALAEYLGIGRTDLRCLDLIVRHGPQSAGHIARALGLTPGSVTALLDRLEASGLAQRHQDPNHGKRVLLAPTARLIELITPEIAERVERGRTKLAAYDTTQLLLIRDFLHTIREGHEQSGANLRGATRRSPTR
ncbi:MAG: marR 1 [Pseudonocardiales bacterium]|nr:marR 1 [Pseudonocardiales bacterium]